MPPAFDVVLIDSASADIERVQVIDYDSDGRLDILMQLENSEVVRLDNTSPRPCVAAFGGPRFTGGSTPGEPNNIHITADVNRDGKLDLLSFSTGLSAWYGLGDGSLTADKSELFDFEGANNGGLCNEKDPEHNGMNAEQSYAVDLDGDGWPELVSSHNGECLSLLSSTAERPTQFAGQFVRLPSFVAFSLVDFDGDGAIDLLRLAKDGLAPSGRSQISGAVRDGRASPRCVERGQVL